MSAYLCNDWHFQFLAAWYLASDYGRHSYNPARYVEGEDNQRRVLAGILKMENHRSVTHRYPNAEPHCQDVPNALPGPIGSDTDVETMVLQGTRYEIMACRIVPMRRPLPVGQDWIGPLFKAVGCYEYQSCEHPGWKDSPARTICEQLKSWAQGKVRGYDGAPWGAPEDLRLNGRRLAGTIG